MNTDINIDDDWQIIPQKRKKNNNIIKKDIYNPSIEELSIGIIKTLKKYDPYGIFLYGSRVNGTHKINSDIDILVIWTHYPVNLESIKQEIINEIKIKIDFVNLVYKEGRKEVKIIDERDEAYYDNIIREAKNIYKREDKNIYINDIIPYSIKLPKIF